MSMTVTSSPRLRKPSPRCDPKNPAPPVIKTLIPCSLIVIPRSFWRGTHHDGSDTLRSDAGRVASRLTNCRDDRLGCRSKYLSNHKSRALAHFIVNPADIFADDPERQDLD